MALLAIGTASLSAQRRGHIKAAQTPEKEMCIQLYSIRDVIGTPELYAKNHVASK